MLLEFLGPFWRAIKQIFGRECKWLGSWRHMSGAPTSSSDLLDFYWGKLVMDHFVILHFFFPSLHFNLYLTLVCMYWFFYFDILLPKHFLVGKSVALVVVQLNFKPFAHPFWFLQVKIGRSWTKLRTWTKVSGCSFFWVWYYCMVHKDITYMQWTWSISIWQP